jgi:hypothetical protein
MSYSKAQSLPTDEQSNRWYKGGIGTVPAPMNEILVQWSGIPEDKISEHIDQLVSHRGSSISELIVGYVLIFMTL